MNNIQYMIILLIALVIVGSIVNAVRQELESNNGEIDMLKNSIKYLRYKYNSMKDEGCADYIINNTVVIPFAQEYNISFYDTLKIAKNELDEKQAYIILHNATIE